MRVKQANILEILKVWLKASAAERTALAVTAAVSLATESKADYKVARWQNFFIVTPFSPPSIYFHTALVVFFSFPSPLVSHNDALPHLAFP